MIVKLIKKCTEEFKRIRLTNKYLSYYLDDLSKGLIKARLMFYLNGKLTHLLASYIKLGYNKWYIPELDMYEENSEFYLFGEGDYYEYCALLLKHSKYKERFKKIGTDISIWKKAPHNIVLVVIKKNIELQDELTRKFKEENPGRLIHEIPYSVMLIGVVGLQYFDVFPPKKDEIFVNAGAFHGETDIDFVKWTNGLYKKIYAFEPMKENVEICKKNYRENGISNIEIFCKGTWSETGFISFTEGENQGCIDEHGYNQIETIRIDDVVGGGITFVKMDIEGAELKALQGARETILRNRPRMAICIYHKSEDLYEIPHYLLSLVPEYRFMVRQYTSMNWETVLYVATESDWKSVGK